MNLASAHWARLGLAAALLGGCGDSGGGDTDGGGTSDAPGSSSAASTDAAATTGAATTRDGSSSGPSDPFDHEPVCSSGKMWTQGNHESPRMNPGLACLDCHEGSGEPEVAERFAIAGTVFPTGHEPDLCDGIDGAARSVIVEVTTADMKVLQLPVNAAGNFMYDASESGPIVFPIRARVLEGDRVRAMASPQSTGDCNACHTQSGTLGAPGRIVEPS